MITKICKQCNKEYQKPKKLGYKLWDKRKFCCRSCADLNKKGVKLVERYKVVCQFCGKEFEVLPHRKNVKFCSKYCMGKSKIGENAIHWKGGIPKCIDCGKTKGDYGGIRCRACSDKLMRGENNPSWKGGITPLVMKIRRCFKYRLWRKAVFELDNYTCQICGKVGHNLNADHIEPFSAIISCFNINSFEKAENCSRLWDISNGRTLCKKCHFKTDTFGYRPNDIYKLLDNKITLCR